MAVFDIIWQWMVGAILVGLSASGVFASSARLARMSKRIGTENSAIARVISVVGLIIGLAFIGAAAKNTFENKSGNGNEPSRTKTRDSSMPPNPVPPPKEGSAVKQAAEEMYFAASTGNYSRVVDFVWQGIVEEAGGRDNMIQLYEEAVRAIRGKGISDHRVYVEEPKVMVVEGKYTFTILPTRHELDSSKGKLGGKSFVLAISTDDGKSWGFVEGTGLATQNDRDDFSPKLPKSLQFPEHQRPQLIKE